MGLPENLFGIARTILRAAEEKPKANKAPFCASSDRLGWSRWNFGCFPRNHYEEPEELKLENSLTWLVHPAWYLDPLVQRCSRANHRANAPPNSCAERRCKTFPFARSCTRAGGEAAVRAANDPISSSPRLIDPEARLCARLSNRKRRRNSKPMARIGKARFAVQGTSFTRTRRSRSDWRTAGVRGYQEGGSISLFKPRSRPFMSARPNIKNRPPFDLPPRWG